MTNFAPVIRYNNPMHYTVYLDLLFLVNFTVDLWILLLEKKLLRLEGGGRRLALGAVLGGVWACLAVLYPAPAAGRHVLAFFAALGIQWAAFPVHSAKTLAMYAAVFYFFAFLLGGIFSAAAGQAGGIPVSLVLVGSSLLGLLLWLGIGWYQERRSRTIVPVELVWNQSVLTLRGLMDTGNRLYTSDGRPVHILSRPAAAGWERMPITGLLWIPYQSVGVPHGLLPAVVMDEMRLPGRVLREPVVAFSKYPVSGSNRYQMIIHSQEALP